MKTKKMRKQLVLGKETITNLERQEQSEVKGGTATLNQLDYDCNPSDWPVKCPPGWYTVYPCEF